MIGEMMCRVSPVIMRHVITCYVISTVTYYEVWLPVTFVITLFVSSLKNASNLLLDWKPHKSTPCCTNY